MPGRIAIKLIALYQHSLGLFFAGRCRFYPSCSEYARQAIEHHGLMRGCAYGLRRLSCCHPWHEGGFDPVPEKQGLSKPSQSSTQ